MKGLSSKAQKPWGCEKQIPDCLTNSKPRRIGSFRRPGGAAGPASCTSEEVSDKSRSAVEMTSDCHRDCEGGERSKGFLVEVVPPKNPSTRSEMTQPSRTNEQYRNHLLLALGPELPPHQ
ncbi:hypothetical protein K443DRAFT_391972 [Laccaria amethystina LaAM-08-1]|uniref:Uncharacterized protein n=1 Tax=Laccaria amethystina LaAM-08-1 TaxID=1095629 RepID=A0A0C9YNQ0_9AGAR|nr:hypothetical protein K443DRAFT_391972 [Laccaria amethystina LaAM-08-1]